jgi:hypothetical protein
MRWADVVAVRRDAMDPQFMSNLSKLGPVSIHDAGKFIRTVSFPGVGTSAVHLSLLFIPLWMGIL